jgi:deoxyribodipyrimidine photo-lyase
MQKFEDECRMEFENVNRAYDTLVKPKMKRISKAWQEGKQAFNSRCLHAMSGCNIYQFRMRAMVVSFSHLIFGNWRECIF